MRMRRQMSEGRPGGNVRKKKKDNLNNRMALVGVTMVVLSLAVAVHIKGIDLKVRAGEVIFDPEAKSMPEWHDAPEAYWHAPALTRGWTLWTD